jgi:hypothetical protein
MEFRGERKKKNGKKRKKTEKNGIYLLFSSVEINKSSF